jgi:hypothetical protein
MYVLELELETISRHSRILLPQYATSLGAVAVVLVEEVVEVESWKVMAVLMA